MFLYSYQRRLLHIILPIEPFSLSCTPCWRDFARWVTFSSSLPMNMHWPLFAAPRSNGSSSLNPFCPQLLQGSTAHPSHSLVPLNVQLRIRRHIRVHFHSHLFKIYDRCPPDMAADIPLCGSGGLDLDAVK